MLLMKDLKVQKLFKFLLEENIFEDQLLDM